MSGRLSEGFDVHAWILVTAFVVVLLTVDLVSLRGRPQGVSTRSALYRSAVWIVLALVFNVGIYFASGKEKALEFLTGYLIEKALSIDNVFVFLIIFARFGVPAESEKRVNFWGSLGALIMRWVFILAGGRSGQTEESTLKVTSLFASLQGFYRLTQSMMEQDSLFTSSDA
jgi:tellurite resistance protein TerC